MISLPNGQTPTDLMLTPNWPDQNEGNGRCGQRLGSRLTMLCAATSAPKTALSQCSSTRNWYSYSTWGKRAMSPTTKMESVTTPLISKARKPASQPTPQKPAASPDSSSHSVLRIEPSDVSTTSHSTTLSSESRARRTWPLSSPSNDLTPIPVRRSTPWSRCISAAIAPITPPSAPTSGAEPRSTTVTGRPNSRPTEATSDPIKPAPMTRTRPGLAASAFCKPAASLLVRIEYTPSRAASLALGHSRARVPVAISRRSYGTCSPLAKRTCLVTRSKPVAAMPSRHSASTCRTRGSLVWSAGTQPFSTCFRKGRAIVRLFRLITDDCQWPGETLLAQCFCGAEPSQGGADNDKAAGALKCCYQIRYFFFGRGGAHDVASPSLPLRCSTKIACTGQAAAARRTFSRVASSGLGSY